MSVTDDSITEFTDNANLLNVAVSRAKINFALSFSETLRKLNGNIHDLINYIKYQQGVVIQSNLRSIFDYLFSQIHAYNRNNGPVSEYDSEDLTFDLIEKSE